MYGKLSRSPLPTPQYNCTTRRPGGVTTRQGMCTTARVSRGGQPGWTLRAVVLTSLQETPLSEMPVSWEGFRSLTQVLPSSLPCSDYDCNLMDLFERIHSTFPTCWVPGASDSSLLLGPSSLVCFLPGGVEDISLVNLRPGIIVPYVWEGPAQGYLHLPALGLSSDVQSFFFSFSDESKMRQAGPLLLFFN